MIVFFKLLKTQQFKVKHIPAEVDKNTIVIYVTK